MLRFVGSRTRGSLISKSVKVGNGGTDGGQKPAHEGFWGEVGHGGHRGEEGGEKNLKKMVQHDTKTRRLAKVG